MRMFSKKSSGPDDAGATSSPPSVPIRRVRRFLSSRRLSFTKHHVDAFPLQDSTKPRVDAKAVLLTMADGFAATDGGGRLLTSLAVLLVLSMIGLLSLKKRNNTKYFDTNIDTSNSEQEEASISIEDDELIRPTSPAPLQTPMKSNGPDPDAEGSPRGVAEEASVAIEAFIKEASRLRAELRGAEDGDSTSSDDDGNVSDGIRCVASRTVASGQLIIKPHDAGPTAEVIGNDIPREAHDADDTCNDTSSDGGGDNCSERWNDVVAADDGSIALNMMEGQEGDLEGEEEFHFEETVASFASTIQHDDDETNDACIDLDERIFLDNQMVPTHEGVGPMDDSEGHDSEEEALERELAWIILSRERELSRKVIECEKVDGESDPVNAAEDKAKEGTEQLNSEKVVDLDQEFEERQHMPAKSSIDESTTSEEKMELTLTDSNCVDLGSFGVTVGHSNPCRCGESDETINPFQVKGDYHSFSAKVPKTNDIQPHTSEDDDASLSATFVGLTGVNHRDDLEPGDIGSSKLSIPSVDSVNPHEIIAGEVDNDDDDDDVFSIDRLGWDDENSSFGSS